MSRPPMMVDETTAAMTSLADQVEKAPQLVAHLPPALINAARRLVVATATHPGAGESATIVPLNSLATNQLIVHLTMLGETVDVAVLRHRLAALGRPTQTSAIGVALHRAVGRHQLERVATGRYRRPTRPDSADCPPQGTSEEASTHGVDSQLGAGP